MPILLLMLLAFAVLVPMGALAMRWGAPWPMMYRRRVRRYDDAEVVELEDAAHDQTSEDPWWYWADILWFVLLVLIVWMLILWLA